MSRPERAERAERAIDLIGLDGFESGLPKELSGGMRQRVGFAARSWSSPRCCSWTSPSAHSTSLAADARGELLELWDKEEFPEYEAIVLVTHNIEEAVILADRIIVLGSNPGRSAPSSLRAASTGVAEHTEFAGARRGGARGHDRPRKTSRRTSPADERRTPAACRSRTDGRQPLGP